MTLDFSVFALLPFEQEYASRLVKMDAILCDIGMLCNLNRQDILASLKLEYKQQGGAISWGDLLIQTQEYVAAHGTLPFAVVTPL
jgi:hypothetical protein